MTGLSGVTAAGQGAIQWASRLVEGQLNGGQAVKVSWGWTELALGGAVLSGLVFGKIAVTQKEFVGESATPAAVSEDRKHRYTALAASLGLAVAVGAILGQKYLPNFFGIKA